MEQLGSAYGIASADASMRTGPALGDWALRLTMFSGLGKITVSCDGLEARYSRVSGEQDLDVIVDVQSRILTALSGHSPTLKYSAEAVGGYASYQVVEGASARDAYFAQVAFPGRIGRHQDVGFKARWRHDVHDVVVACDVAPVWTDSAAILFSFEADISRLDPADFTSRAKIAAELVNDALRSFDLEVIE